MEKEQKRGKDRLIKIVKSHKIDPSSTLLILRSDGSDSLQLNILRRIDLIEKEENGKEVSAEKVSEARSADIIPFSKSED